MKKIVAAVVLIIMTVTALAEPGSEMKLTADISGTRLMERWEGQTSNDYDWFIIDLHLTNWHVDTQNISELLSGRLIYKDVYSFEANPSFDGDAIPPLVEKTGALVFQIPKMVSQTFSPEDVRVYISVEGEEKPVELNTTYTVKGYSGTLEGPGYETPEDAVLAYIDGMNNGNASEMLSTFAIESFVEHVDPESYVMRMGAYNYTMTSALPLFSEYAKTIMLNARHGDIARNLLYQYVELSAKLDGTMARITDESEAQAFFDLFRYSPVDPWKGKVEFVRWIDPTSLSDKFITETNLRNIAIQMSPAGAEDYQLLAAHILLNGVDAIQTMSCIKYDGHWYNHELSNNIAILLGLNMYYAGLLYPTEGEEFDITGMLSNVSSTPENAVLIEAWENSDLLGSHWLLTSLNQTGITVYDSAEDARNASSTGVYGEIRFTHYGGAIADITFSPSLTTYVALGTSHLKAAAVWNNMGGRIQLGEIRGAQAQITMDGPECTRTDDNLILRWPDGLQATLQRMND